MKFHFHFSPTRSLYALAALIVLVAAYSVIGERGPFHLWRLRAEKVKLDEQNQRLQKENEVLRQRIARLRHDDSYLERIAREELNLARPGEIIYRFRSTETRNERPRALTESPAGPRPPKEQKQRQGSLR
jgi:cell division protein FtsB